MYLEKTNLSMIPDDYYSKAADYMPEKPFGLAKLPGHHLMHLEANKPKEVFLYKQLIDLLKIGG